MPNEAAPTDLLAMFSLASLLVAQGKYPEAIQRLEAAIKLHIDLPILQLSLAAGRESEAGTG